MISYKCNDECSVGDPSPPSEVNTIISRLDNSLQDLERTITRLECRLQLVLVDNQLCDANCKKECKTQSTLGTVLDNFHDRIVVSTNYIENLIDRLAI